MFVHGETTIVVSYTSSVLNPSGFTNIKNGRTSMTGHAVCKITRLAGKMALGGSPLTMTDVCTGMATWMLTGTRVTLISTCGAAS